MPPVYYVLKQQVIKSASEVAAMITRIDDVIAAGRMKAPPTPPGGPGGMPGGYGGMPPGYYRSIERPPNDRGLNSMKQGGYCRNE